MKLPLTKRQAPSFNDRRIDALMRKRHSLDERDLFACDGFPEIRKLGRLALRLEGDERMNTYFAIGDMCAGRSLGIDGRLLVFYVGKTLNAYLRARSDARDAVNRRLAERARTDYLGWLIATAQENVSRHNVAVALWAVAELGESDPQSAALHEGVLPRLFKLYRNARPEAASPDPFARKTMSGDDSTLFGVDTPQRDPNISFEALAMADLPAEDRDANTNNTLGDSDAGVPLPDLLSMGESLHEIEDAGAWQGAPSPQQEAQQIGQVLDSLELTTMADQSAVAFESFEKQESRERFFVSLLTRAEAAPSNPNDVLAGEYHEGDRINGRYEVAAVLLGGMGVVYLCYDHEEREPIALKSFQNRFLQNERAVARFEQEALTWIRLEKHRHIVQAQLVQRIGTRPYIMLEHISGPEGLGTDLRSWIEQKRVSHPQAVELGLHVALGMQHAVGRVPGLVHRDLKPANILVTHDGIAKVTDFGLVRSLDVEDITPMDLAMGRDRDDNRLTRMGAIIGTAPYLSPEQCRSNNVDTRSDIYAFGCMLYEMLTGSLVFQARNLPAWLQAHLNERPLFDPVVRQTLSPSLVALVLACLEKDPNNRPQTWGEIVNQLAGIYREMTGEAPIMEITGQSLAAHELMDKAYSLTELGRIEEALIAYDNAIALESENAWAWARKGRALRLLRRYQDALECYDRALGLQPRYAWAWKGRGMVLERMDRLPEALECHRQAAALDPSDVWNWYNQAETLYSLGDLDAALELLSRALEVDPRHANSWGKRGQILRQQRRNLEAIEAYRQAVEIDPTFAWAHNGCGLALKLVGEINEAVLSFKRAVRYAPKEVWYWYNLAETLVEAGYYEEALQPVQEAVRVDPKHAFSWAKQGQVLRYLKRYKEALSAYHRAVALQPDNAWAHNGCGIVLERMERYEEALASYSRAAELSPEDVWYWYNRGNMLITLERYEEAVVTLQQAVQVNENHANSWARMGSALRWLNRYDEALNALEKATALQADFVWAWGEKGQVLEALGRADEARDAYRRAGEPGTSTPHSALTQADQLLSAGQPAQAAELLERALETDPRHAGLWGKYGLALRRLNRYEDAVKAFDNAIEIDPRYAWAWNGRGMALSALKRPADALASFEHAAEIDKTDVWHWYNQGDALMALDRPQEALVVLEQAVTLDPAHAESWAKQGQVLRRLNRNPEALVAYDRALGLQPQYSWAWNGRGLTLESMRRREEAVASYERALSLDHSVIWYHNNLIDILLDMGRKADALSASEAAVSALPDNAMAWARRGLAQRRTGSYTASVESYARALELDPNYGWAWNGFGLAHLSQHHYEDAADAFERAVQLNPKDVWFWRNLGDALMMVEDYKAAVHAFEQAVKLDSQHESTRLKLQMAREALGE